MKVRRNVEELRDKPIYLSVVKDFSWIKLLCVVVPAILIGTLLFSAMGDTSTIKKFLVLVVLTFLFQFIYDVISYNVVIKGRLDNRVYLKVTLSNEVKLCALDENDNETELKSLEVDCVEIVRAPLPTLFGCFGDVSLVVLYKDGEKISKMAVQDVSDLQGCVFQYIPPEYRLDKDRGDY